MRVPSAERTFRSGGKSLGVVGGKALAESVDRERSDSAGLDDSMEILDNDCEIDGEILPFNIQVNV